MQEDRFTELALEALVCRDEQQKEALWQEALAIEEARLNKLMNKRKQRKRKYIMMCHNGLRW